MRLLLGKNVLFSDESRFDLVSDDYQERVWREIGGQNRLATAIGVAPYRGGTQMCPCDVSTFAGSCKLVVDLSTSIAFTARLPLMKLDVLQTQPSNSKLLYIKCGEAVETAKHVIFDCPPFAEEEARIWKLSRRREDRCSCSSWPNNINFMFVKIGKIDCSWVEMIVLSFCKDVSFGLKSTGAGGPSTCKTKTKEFRLSNIHDIETIKDILFLLSRTMYESMVEKSLGKF
nr:unnamed protein product [Callosobruchus chinensis]